MPGSYAQNRLLSQLCAVTCALCSTLYACSVGHGEGRLSGMLAIDGCRAEAPYDLGPTAFFAQAAEDLLRIRVQRGSDLEVRSDGLAVLVHAASEVKKQLGTPIDLSAMSMSMGTQVDASVYFNESCPPGRDKTPVVLSAVSGTIRFDAIYAPEVDRDEVEINAELENARFEDPRNEKRWAELNGSFKFLYVRGSPAQRFP